MVKRAKCTNFKIQPYQDLHSTGKEGIFFLFIGISPIKIWSNVEMRTIEHHHVEMRTIEHHISSFGP